MNHKSLVGQKFGRLLVQERTTKVGSSVHRYKCLCDCGNLTEVSSSNLISGGTKSCRCLQKEYNTERLTKPVEKVISTQIKNYYKRNAKERGLSWELTFSEFKELIFSPCYYCGKLGGTETFTTWDRKSARDGRSLRNNGIDRLDSSVGYLFQNCVSCCKHCNFAKMARTKDEFLNWIQEVYLFNKEYYESVGNFG